MNEEIAAQPSNEATTTESVVTESTESTEASVEAPVVQQDSKWHEKLEDDVLKGLIVNKSWDDDDINVAMPKVLKSYSELEKLNGKDKIVLPKSDDAEGLNDFYNKLGRPESSDLYGLEAPEGLEVNKDLEGWFRDSAHTVGLSDKQAQDMYNSYNETVGAQNEAILQEQKIQNEISEKELMKEWGQAYEHKMQQAQDAARKFIGKGNEEKINAIEKVMGYSDTMKFFNSIGSKIGEHGSVDSNPEVPMSPEEASYSLDTLNSNKPFMAKYLSDRKNGTVSDETRKMAHLYDIISKKNK